MKSLIISAVMLSAFASQAGVIKNSKTGDFIQVELDQASKKARIYSDINGEKREGQVSLKDYKFVKETLNYNYRDQSVFAAPFAGTSSLIDSVAPTEVVVVAITPAVAMDVLLLPITIPAGLFNQDSYGRFKKDIKVIQASLESETFEKSVSDKQFKRIKKLTSILIK